MASIQMLLRFCVLLLGLFIGYQLTGRAHRAIKARRAAKPKIKPGQRHQYYLGFELNRYHDYTKSGPVVRRLMSFFVLFVSAWMSLFHPTAAFLVVFQYLGRIFCRPVPNKGDHYGKEK